MLFVQLPALRRHLQVDSRNRIWFLWSSSIRLAVERDLTSIAAMETENSNKAINIDSVIQLPPDVELVDKASHSDSDVEPIVKLTCTRLVIYWSILAHDVLSRSCGQRANYCQFHPVR